MTATPTLENMLDIAGAHAENVLVALGFEQLTPAYLLIYPEAAGFSVEIISCIWENPDQETAIVAEVRKRAREIGAVALSFVAEAWSRLGTDDPEPLELVIASATDGEQKRFRSWKIVRARSDGPIISLIRGRTAAAAGTAENRMIDDILPQRTVH